MIRLLAVEQPTASVPSQAEQILSPAVDKQTPGLTRLSRSKTSVVAQPSRARTTQIKRCDPSE